MKFISTNNNTPPVSFQKAAFQGLAPDGGLYMPEAWPHLDGSFFDQIENMNLPQIGTSVSKLFIDALSEDELKKIMKAAFNFEAPLVEISEDINILELFHGPTLAFKDFGARFMSRVFSALREQTDQDLIILAATSGDTGSAVAQGFLGIDGIKVCLLYPSGKVSHIQEQQLTSAGRNVSALEIDGSFDDCQRLVKQAFSDDALNEKLLLSSANSINIARLIPQMFYYFSALSQLKSSTTPIFVVPSGNFGNLTAGLMAEKIGLPSAGFIAATNKNNVVPEYLRTGEFKPRASQRTISNAMDVGNPSNFDRIQHFFGGNHAKIRQRIWGASFSDESTKEVIRKVYEQFDYLMDPHTAVGYRAVQEYVQSGAKKFTTESSPFIVLATAHPSKFRDVLEPVIGKEVDIPERLKTCLEKEKQSVAMSDNYGSLKAWLLNNYR